MFLFISHYFFIICLVFLNLSLLIIYVKYAFIYLK